jgi:hypothetical protein
LTTCWAEQFALLISGDRKAEEARELERRRSMWSAPLAATMVGWSGTF